MTTATESTTDVPWPAGAEDVSEWADVGRRDEFRLFYGPTPYKTGPDAFAPDTVVVSIFGTQLRDGAVEGRCVRMSGVHWDDELDGEKARAIGQALIAAADDLDRLGQR